MTPGTDPSDGLDLDLGFDLDIRVVAPAGAAGGDDHAARPTGIRCLSPWCAPTTVNCSPSQRVPGCG